MDLQPQAAVESFLAHHEDALAKFSGHLEIVVPKAIAKFEPEYLASEDVPGDALCSVVRALLWRRAEQTSKPEDSLSVARRGTSKHLVAAQGDTVRVRRHPWDHAKCRRVGVTVPEVWTLWGVDWSLAPYELAILWTPNLSSKSLASASLAAVADLDGSSPTIYWREALPVADVMSELHVSRAVSDDLDDFEDYADEQPGEDDPA